MNKFKIIFFDCDGVLLFGHPLTQLEKKLDISIEITEQMGAYYKGNLGFQDWVDNIERLYKKVGLKKDYYEQMMNYKNYEINEEAEDLVGYLKKKGYEIAIISSGSAEYVSGVAHHLGIKYFKVNTILNFDKDGNFTSLETFGEDPQVKVDQINQICKLLDINPQDAIFIGDSDNDLSAFDFTKHGILYGSRFDLENHAWKRVDDLRDVIKVLEDEN